MFAKKRYNVYLVKEVIHTYKFTVDKLSNMAKQLDLIAAKISSFTVWIMLTSLSKENLKIPTLYRENWDLQRYALFFLFWLKSVECGSS